MKHRYRRWYLDSSDSCSILIDAEPGDELAINGKTAIGGFDDPEHAERCIRSVNALTDLNPEAIKPLVEAVEKSKWWLEMCVNEPETWTGTTIRDEIRVLAQSLLDTLIAA
jgi:hypothetical protein